MELRIPAVKLKVPGMIPARNPARRMDRVFGPEFSPAHKDLDIHCLSTCYLKLSHSKWICKTHQSIYPYIWYRDYIIDNSTSRYLDNLLNIDNNFFDSMVNRIYPSELQLNKANVSDAEASFLDLHLSISDGFVKTKKFIINEMILIFIL